MALPTASDNPFASLLITEGTAPASPAAGKRRLYVLSSDHLAYLKDSSGTVVSLTIGGYVPGGTDVPIADGGTGQSTKAAAFDALSPMTTAGDIIIGGTAGTGTRLAAGTSTYVLTSNGAGAAPSYQAPAGGSAGALVLLEQHPASSSATLDFTTFISATYNQYMFIIEDLFPGTNNTDLWMRFGTGGGPSWDAGANYTYLGTFDGIGDGFTRRTASAAAQFVIASNIFTTANTNTSGHVNLLNINGAGQKTFESELVSDVGALYYWTQHGRYLSLTAVTGVRFLMSSGNIASGTIRVYGIAKT